MATNGTTKYAVLGTGCIGCIVGISLASVKYDVMFIGRKSARFAEICEKRKLTMILPEAHSEPKVLQCEQSLTTNEELGLKGRKVIFVATKRTANKDVAVTIAKYAEQGAMVVLLQNGLEASKEMNEILKSQNRDDLMILDSVVSFNVVETTPGEFHWVTKRSDSTVAIDGSKYVTLAEDNVCVAVRAAGINCYADKSFMEVATGKLIINLINAPNALAGCDTETMLTTEGYRRVWGESIREARAVFRAMGVKRQRGPQDKGNFLAQHLEQLLDLPNFMVAIIARVRQTKGGKASMLQDLEKRVDETEIDFITGHVVKLGIEYKIPTPVSAKLVELVKEATAKKAGSPNMKPEEMVAAVGLRDEPSSCSIS